MSAAASFATQPLPAGPNTVVLTTAGGWGVVTADAIARDPDLAVAPRRPLSERATDAEGRARFEHLVAGDYALGLVEDAGGAPMGALVDPLEAIEDPGRARVRVEDGSQHLVQLLERLIE